MIANISAAISSFEETLNTLKYANRAKNIKTNISRNVLSVNHHISEYVALISGLRGEIAKLKQQLAEQHTDEGDPVPNKLDGMDEIRNLIVENFRERMQLRRSLIELEDQNVQNSIEVGKRQLFIFEWEEGRSKGAGAPKQQLRSLDSQIDLLEAGKHDKVISPEIMKDAPEDVKVRAEVVSVPYSLTVWHIPRWLAQVCLLRSSGGGKCDVSGQLAKADSRLLLVRWLGRSASSCVRPSRRTT
jgi:kinesin family member 18/19